LKRREGGGVYKRGVHVSLHKSMVGLSVIFFTILSFCKELSLYRFIPN
jgi:hypothetical protein